MPVRPGELWSRDFLQVCYFLLCFHPSECFTETFTYGVESGQMGTETLGGAP